MNFSCLGLPLIVVLTRHSEASNLQKDNLTSRNSPSTDFIGAIVQGINISIYQKFSSIKTADFQSASQS